jgi:FtsP/CotA-like multicopper oxidase with cupredoxin domain
MWHSHSGLQRADGLFGAVIVRQKLEEEKISSFYDYDLSEHVIVMNDWFDYPIALSFALHVHYDRSRFNWADSILINGRGSSKKTNYTLDSKNYLTPKASFRVKSGYRYRFRLIHAGISHCAFQFSIEDHNLTIIATDGHYVEPFDVQALALYAGERFDIVVNANRSTSTTYLIKVKGLGNCENAKAYETAYLVYDDTKIVEKEIAYESLIVSGKV